MKLLLQGKHLLFRYIFLKFEVIQQTFNYMVDISVVESQMKARMISTIKL